MSATTMTIKFYGTRWCGQCLAALRVLDNRKVTYEWINIDKDPEGEAFVKQTNHGNRSVPTIVFPDGTILVEPSSTTLTAKLDTLDE